VLTFDQVNTVVCGAVDGLSSTPALREFYQEVGESYLREMRDVEFPYEEIVVADFEDYVQDHIIEANG
jgi:hypothetical protein